MWHVLEHLDDPVPVLRGLSDMLTDNGSLLIEVPNADDALISLYESDAFKDFTYWECHLYLYTTETLKRLVDMAGLKVNFITQYQRYPLSNHLYWLTKGKPGGHIVWNMIRDEALDKAYGAKLARLGIADTIIAEVGK